MHSKSITVVGGRQVGALVATVVLGVAIGIAQASQILSIGSPEYVGAGGIKPDVAIDSLGRPHAVVMPSEGNSHWYVFDRDGVAAPWTRTDLVLGDYYQPVGSFNNPTLEIDQYTDRVWISGIQVIPSSVPGTGMGIYTRESATSDNKTYAFMNRWVMPYNEGWPIGWVSIDPHTPDKAIVMVTKGYWDELLGVGTSIVSTGWEGKMGIGYGGERHAFHISKGPSVNHGGSIGMQGVWHTALGGAYGYWPSYYQNSLREAAGRERVAWMDANVYREQGYGDGNYVSVCGDTASPGQGYMACDSKDGRGILVNIWDGSRMLFPPERLLHVDAPGGTTAARRYAPQWAAAVDGGAFLCWVNGGNVRLAYVAPDAGNPLPNGIQTICPGQHPSIATDASGNLHLIYNLSGSTYYRKLEVSGSAWDAGSQDLGGGWRRQSWFGDYFPFGETGWIWHCQHGFLYVSSDATPWSIWFYSEDMGWLWTTRSFYPLLYRHTDGAVLWYNGDTNPRWFFNMSTQDWEQW